MSRHERPTRLRKGRMWAARTIIRYVTSQAFEACMGDTCRTWLEEIARWFQNFL
ncbi:hypothetical protein [Streptomyces sp. NPDC053367]|uniref:hypothetical protein n=1 Tax=Streptomyces sp. NPDC053367 TaxID=3365700 RepID=UPI0037D6E448